MRRDTRPYFIRSIRDRFERWRIRRFLEPQFDTLGPGLSATYPAGIELWGANIHAGTCLHLRAAKGNMIRLATWDNGERVGEIRIGDYVLISPGNQIIASEKITIGTDTMIASGCYISDSDWHDTYDRTAERDKHAPIVLEENVWIGAHVIIGKGVTIGENSIIGAGSVVVSDIPANVIAAGNPARVVKQLDPSRTFTKRTELLSDMEKIDIEVDRLQRYLLRNNTIFSWIRATFAPTHED
ncbi:MAG: acetyltransferase [Rhodobiaceae bacterium]|nr:MAG: acetyltransferase [Rhodobiaceae bacterium]